MFLRRQGTSHAPVPQTMPLDASQIRNHAGGYVYAVDKWDVLDRFLKLGSAGGTYYASQGDLTKQGTDVILECLAEDGLRTVSELARVSDEGLALKQDYALYALALALSEDDLDTRAHAYPLVPKVCRTASTLFQLLSYLKGRRGWSRGLRSTIARWYDERSVDALGYQMVKYRERNGFTHRDALRLAHPSVHANLYAWTANKSHDVETLPRVVRDYLAVSTSTGIDLDRVSRLPREALPTEWLRDKRVWEELLFSGMPLTALLRNLGNLGKNGVLGANSKAAGYVAGRLGSAEDCAKARLHPIGIYLAASTYNSGKSVKGSGSWAPVGQISTALDDAFMLAFRNVVPTGKRVLVAVDVSGSMVGARIENTSLTAAKVASAMAFITARTEPGSQVIGFDYTGWGTSRGTYSGVYRYKIGADERLRDFQARFTNPGGGTDCSLPFAYASEKKLDFDAIVIFTDGETWAGARHAQQALNAYRSKVKHCVKVIDVAMTVTNHSVIDPSDRDVLQIAGFSADVPAVISEFLRR